MEHISKSLKTIFLLVVIAVAILGILRVLNYISMGRFIEYTKKTAIIGLIFLVVAAVFGLFTSSSNK